MVGCAGITAFARAHERPLLLAALGIGTVGALSACRRRTPTPQPSPAPQPSPTPSPTPPTSSSPPPATPSTITVGQLNAQNAFDTTDAPRVQDTVLTAAQYHTKTEKLARAIRDQLHAPDIVALEEVENEGVLRDITANDALAAMHYQAILIPGSDPRGINVALLYRPDRVDLVAARQEQTTTTTASGRRIKLFTRPPLVATFRPHGSSGTSDAAAGAQQLTVVANHFTSKLQGSDGDTRRLEQARWVAALATGRAGSVQLDPTSTVVVGDLNAGPGEAPLNALAGAGLVALTDRVPDADRYSIGATKSKRQLFDHALTSAALASTVTDVSIPHRNTSATAAQRLDASTSDGASDHDPVAISITR